MSTTTATIETDVNPKPVTKKKTKVITTFAPGAEIKDAKKSKDLKSKNLATSAAKVEPKDKTKAEPKKTESTRELKYVYPADCLTKDQKKTFRRTSRAALAKFTKELEKLKASNTKEDQARLKEAQKEFAQFQQATYPDPKKN